MNVSSIRPSAPTVSWLQHAVALGAALQTARVARRLRPEDGAWRAQESTRVGLMRRFATTAFGRGEGIETGIDYATLQARVPPRSYEDFIPWIERMKRGETGVLWPGRCVYFAVSSGTTAGRTKYLPITNEMIAHFRRAGLDSLCLYARRTGSARVFRGRHLFLGGSTALTPLPQARPFRAWGGDLSGISAINLPRWVERHLYEPGREIAQLEDWPAKLRAIVARTATRNISLLAGIPSWILIFAEEMRAKTGRETLQEVWPHLECLVHGGVPIAPFWQPLREALGAKVNFHEVYPASEGFIAAQDATPSEGLRLLADAGIFYEFLPMSRFDESRLSELGRDLVPLADVQSGIDYALVMTTPGGLCRYIIGDVVRFISTSPARLIYVGRTQLQLSAFGEHVIEKELTDALATVCDRNATTIVNFHVAPLFVEPERGITRGRHEWWIELEQSETPWPGGPTFAFELDAVLQSLNDDYAAKRVGGGLDLPAVHLLAPGTFERWMRSRGKWGGQNKVPRCRSDREVANDLIRFQ